jgi:hypothetical protein
MRQVVRARLITVISACCPKFYLAVSTHGPSAVQEPHLVGILRAVIILGAVLVFPSVGPAQITLNQIDTFESGTTLNWTNGGAPGALSVPSGGPGGASDHYLQVTSSGSGPGGSLTVFNRTQWLGNYVAAGVNGIDVDLLNPGSSALTIRIAYRTGTTGGGTPGYVSTNGFNLPGDGLWHHAVFSLSDASMTPIGSPPSPFSTFITQPAEMRIIDSSSLSLTGDFVNARLGVDNIQAVFIPVPELTYYLALAAAAGIAGWLRRRRLTVGKSNTRFPRTVLCPTPA